MTISLALNDSSFSLSAIHGYSVIARDGLNEFLSEERRKDEQNEQLRNDAR